MVTTLATLGVLMAFGAGIWVGCGVTIKSAQRILAIERAWKDALKDALASALRQVPPAVGSEIIKKLEKAKVDG